MAPSEIDHIEPEVAGVPPWVPRSRPPFTILDRFNPDMVDAQPVHVVNLFADEVLCLRHDVLNVREKCGERAIRYI